MNFKEIATIISELFEVPVESLSPDTLLVEDLDANSIDFIDLAMSFEDTFNMEFPDEALERFKTIGDIVNFVEKKQNK